MVRNIGVGSEQCKIPHQIIDTRQENYRRIVKEVLKDYPNVATFDPMLVLCNANYCYGGKGGYIFYKDDDHLSITGSKFIALDLRNAILKAQKK